MRMEIVCEYMVLSADSAIEAERAADNGHEAARVEEVVRLYPCGYLEQTFTGMISTGDPPYTY